jgi:adenine-specific DNA-methyltransferase
VIYDDNAIVDGINTLKKLIEVKQPKERVKVYVFSNGQYPYTEEFEDILDSIELCALPDVIYKAYKNVLPAKERDIIPELEEPTTQEMEVAMQQSSNFHMI